MFFIFDLFKSILFFVNCISLHFFHACLIKYYHIMFINIVPPLQGTVYGLQVHKQFMDYRSVMAVVSQEIHPLFRGVATPGEDRPELQFRPLRLHFVRARFTSVHAHASLLVFFSFSVLFHSCCSHAQVFGKTLLHEFLISYSHTE